MNELLKLKLQSWSPEVFQEINNFMPVLPSDTSDFITDMRVVERDGDTLYSIGEKDALCYNNNGTLEYVLYANSLVYPDCLDTTHDVDSLSKLDFYNDQSYRVAKITNIVNDGECTYITYQSPEQQLGLSFLADFLTNYTPDQAEEWVKSYIDGTTWMIKALTATNCLFPANYQHTHLFRDNKGYYFLGVSGFNLSKEEFITGRLAQLNESEVTSLLMSFNIDVVALKNYASEKWTQ